MKLYGVLGVCLLSIAFAAPAWAWGTEGHEIVATIALRNLTPRAMGQVAQLLGDEAMVIHDANWADEIRGQRPETGPWHYVNIPIDSAGYDPRRDCGGGNCVVAQIDRDAAILGNAKLPGPQRAEALRFLVHFVADVHQPLHAADNDDRGGNTVRAFIDGERTSLHHVWDQQMVEASGPDAAAVAGSILAGITPVQRRAWQSGKAADWANESFRLAHDDLYAFLDGRRSIHIGHGYIRHETPVARMQMARAGLRLAWLLNTTLK